MFDFFQKLANHLNQPSGIIFGPNGRFVTSNNLNNYLSENNVTTVIRNKTTTVVFINGRFYNSKSL